MSEDDLELHGKYLQEVSLLLIIIEKYLREDKLW